MPNEFVTIFPEDGSTIVNKNPVMGGTITIELATIIEIRFTWTLSRTPTPESDPNAIFLAAQSITEHVGYSRPYTVWVHPGILEPGDWYVVGRGYFWALPFGWVEMAPHKVHQFTVVNKPTATPTGPAIGTTLPFRSGANNFLASWRYDGGDWPQASYQVQVHRSGEGTPFIDTGEIGGTATSRFLTIPDAEKDKLLTWRVRVKNQYGTWSEWSPANPFSLGSPPTASITSPTHNQALTTTTPQFTIVGTAAGGRGISRVTIAAYEGQREVQRYVANGSWTSGQSITLTIPNLKLKNETGYTYRAKVVDSAGLESVEVVRVFSVSLPKPGIPAVPTISVANIDDTGYAIVSFIDQNRSADFVAWIIERRDEMLTGELVENYREVGRLYDNTGPYQFFDSSIPMSHNVRYRLRQLAAPSGVELLSDPSAAAAPVSTTSEEYWLFAGINGDPNALTTKLYNVVADSFSDEQEENEFIILGGGRYVERGTELGVKGTLELKLRNTDGTTARQKRMALKRFKEAATIATLRTPFGDVFHVHLGNMSISRIAGVGQDEFCDVSLPYTEVVS